MVKSRKQSKRLPARKKYKIERKVREHNRKERKDAKKNAHSKKLKKDPGIPNLFPFKEQLLQQMQARKERVEGEKERQRQQRQLEHAKRRRSLQALKNDAQRRVGEFEKKGAIKAEIQMSGLHSDPSLRAYYREFRKVVEASDVVLEVLDARDPLGCRCLQVERAVLGSGTNKKLILVLNKMDLVPKEVVEKWLKHLRNEFPTIAFKASTQSQKQHLSQKKFPLGSGPTSLMETSACLGAEVLLKLLGNYCRNVDIKTSITVGVVGLPNVGKSSLINSLKRSRACNVGATPGLTKSLQEIQLDKHVKLLDSPGIVVTKCSADSAAMILRNCVKLESLSDPIPPVESILKRCNKYQVLEHYCIPEFQGVQEFLSHLAHKTGKLKKGGVPDVDAAARSVLRDWNTGKIRFYTHPPEQQTLASHVSAEVVQQWSKEFDINALVEEEKKDLSELGPAQAAMEITPQDPHDDQLADLDDEDMDSELSEEDSCDEMEEEEGESAELQQDHMTVVLGKKPATKNPVPRAVRRTNPDPGRERQRALKRREKLIQQLVSRGKGDKMETNT